MYILFPLVYVLYTNVVLTVLLLSMESVRRQAWKNHRVHIFCENRENFLPFTPPPPAHPILPSVKQTE